MGPGEAKGLRQFTEAGGFLMLTGDDEAEIWDVDTLSDMVGRMVLIGLTALDGQTVVERYQVHGRVANVDPARGVQIMLVETGRPFWLPGEREAFDAAPIGDYRLSATGEVVRNPDLFTTWAVHVDSHLAGRRAY
jgi:hypothetical protein